MWLKLNSEPGKDLVGIKEQSEVQALMLVGHLGLR